MKHDLTAVWGHQEWQEPRTEFYHHPTPVPGTGWPYAHPAPNPVVPDRNHPRHQVLQNTGTQPHPHPDEPESGESEYRGLPHDPARSEPPSHCCGRGDPGANNAHLQNIHARHSILPGCGVNADKLPEACSRPPEQYGKPLAWKQPRQQHALFLPLHEGKARRHQDIHAIRRSGEMSRKAPFIRISNETEAEPLGQGTRKTSYKDNKEY